MSRPLHIFLPILAAALLCSSCATIISGRKQSVSITSSDPQSQVIIDGESHGFGSRTVSLARDEMHVIEVIPTKGAPRRANINSRANIWIILNAIIPGGFIATITDCLTGAAFSLNPDSVEFDFSQPDGAQHKD